MTIAESPKSMTGSALVPASPRELVLRRAAALSRELRKAARVARMAKAPAFQRASSAIFGARRAPSLWENANPWLVRSFLAIAVVPSLLCILYFGLIASDQYVAEARFAVRTSEVQSFDAIASATGISSLQQAQDSMIVLDYVRSRAIVGELEKLVGLRKMYARDDVDYLSRFDSSYPIEDLVRYWRSHVRTSIEMPSGIITMEVRAFSPEEALRTADAVVMLSERLINTMSERAQRDLVAHTEAEVRRAEQRLRQARAALLDLRNQTGTLDPRLQGEGINRMIEQIRLDRIKMEQELSTVTRTLSEQAPQVQILRARIQATNEQIAYLERQLTTPIPSGDRTVSSQILRFDELELERQVAEKQYTAAMTALERARVSAEQQKVYLTTFVRPVLATEATYPKRFWYSLVAVLGFLLAWVVVMTLLAKAHERLTQ